MNATIHDQLNRLEDACDGLITSIENVRKNEKLMDADSFRHLESENECIDFIISLTAMADVVMEATEELELNSDLAEWNKLLDTLVDL